MAGDGPTSGVKDATNADIFNLLSGVKETQARQDERGKAREERFDRLETAVNGMRDQLSELVGQNHVTREQVAKLDEARTDHETRLRATEAQMDDVKANRTAIESLQKSVDELTRAIKEKDDKQDKRVETLTGRITKLEGQFKYWLGGGAVIGGILAIVGENLLRMWIGG